MTSRRGLVVPQNTFLENIIKRSHGVHENFLLASAQIPESPIAYCSEGFIELTGYKKNHIVGKKSNLSFMYGSLTAKDAVRELRNALQEKTSAQIEVLLYKKDGTPFWLLVNVGIIKDELENNVLFFITFQDVSEFKEPINPAFRKHRWAEFNKAIHAKPTTDNPVSKAKEEKNRIQIGQLMENTVEELPDYKQDIPKTPWYIILHCSTPKVIWDWFILVFILYTATAVPFIICFKFESTSMTIADTFVDFMFLIDIVLNFHTSYVDEDSNIVFDAKRIRRHYLRGWFIVDLITSLPYGVVALMAGNEGMGITSFISFLKALRLLRLNRVVRALDQYLEYGFITLILWMLFFCLCSHWMACIFFAIADHYDNFADTGWVRAMSLDTDQPLVIVNNTVITKPTLASLYMSSLYFSLTSLTSIGFGNIAPNTTAEKIFSCITMIFGGLCYAVIFGQVTAIVQQSQKKSESYHHTLDNMRAFCKLYKVPKEISTRIIDYYMYNWALTKGVDTNQVLQHCPKDLQSDICIHLNKKIIDTNPAFRELSNAVLRAIARNFAIHRVAPGERIVHEGESLETLFFVASGSFEITYKGNVIGLVGEGDVFGDDVCRTSDVGKSAADVFALTYGDVHSIGREDLVDALSFYPEYGELFSKVFRLSYNLRQQEASQSQVPAGPPKSARRLNPLDLKGRRNSFLSNISDLNGIPNNNLGISPVGLEFGVQNSNGKLLGLADNPGIQMNGTGIRVTSPGSDVNDSGVDEDMKQYNDFHSKKKVISELSEMKVEVKREMDDMNGKMHDLEANIASILKILGGEPQHSVRERKVVEKDDNTTTNNNTLAPLLMPAAMSASRTSLIVDKAKSEIPETVLPDWVNTEYGGDGDDGGNENEEKVDEKQKNGLNNKPKKKGLKKKVEARKKDKLDEVKNERPLNDIVCDVPFNTPRPPSVQNSSEASPITEMVLPGSVPDLAIDIPEENVVEKELEKVVKKEPKVVDPVALKIQSLFGRKKAKKETASKEEKVIREEVKLEETLVKNDSERVDKIESPPPPLINFKDCSVDDNTNKEERIPEIEEKEKTKKKERDESSNKATEVNEVAQEELLKDDVLQEQSIQELLNETPESLPIVDKPEKKKKKKEKELPPDEHVSEIKDDVLTEPSVPEMLNETVGSPVVIDKPEKKKKKKKEKIKQELPEQENDALLPENNKIQDHLPRTAAVSDDGPMKDDKSEDIAGLSDEPKEPGMKDGPIKEEDKVDDKERAINQSLRVRSARKPKKRRDDNDSLLSDESRNLPEGDTNQNDHTGDTNQNDHTGDTNQNDHTGDSNHDNQDGVGMDGDDGEIPEKAKKSKKKKKKKKENLEENNEGNHDEIPLIENAVEQGSEMQDEEEASVLTTENDKKSKKKKKKKKKEMKDETNEVSNDQLLSEENNNEQSLHEAATSLSLNTENTENIEQVELS